jgi:sulfur carrier protein
MRLVVNGSNLAVDVATLSQLIEHLGYTPTAVATAVNGEFIAAVKRRAVNLSDDDRIEIVAARQGG